MWNITDKTAFCHLLKRRGKFKALLIYHSVFPWYTDETPHRNVQQIMRTPGTKASENQSCRNLHDFQIHAQPSLHSQPSCDTASIRGWYFETIVRVSSSKLWLWNSSADLSWPPSLVTCEWVRWRVHGESLSQSAALTRQTHTKLTPAVCHTACLLPAWHFVEARHGMSWREQDKRPEVCIASLDI